MAEIHRDPGAQAELDTRTRQVVADHNELRGIMAAVGAEPNRLEDDASWLLPQSGDQVGVLVDELEYSPHGRCRVIDAGEQAAFPGLLAVLE